MSEVKIVSIIRTASTFALYTVREMANNRLLIITIAFALTGLGFAGFISEIAITENEEIQVSLLAASYRYCAAFVIMVFVVSSIVREFNDKCLELYLSMPISRTIYFVGKCAGFILTGMIIALLFSFVLLLYASPFLVFQWWLSLTMELAIISVFAFFAVLTFNQQVTASVFITFFFYLLARLTDTIVLVSQSQILPETLGNNIIEFMLYGLFTILPHFAAFTKTDWLVYGVEPAELFPLMVQTLVYCLLLGGMAMWDFIRKNI